MSRERCPTCGAHDAIPRYELRGVVHLASGRQVRPDTDPTVSGAWFTHAEREQLIAQKLLREITPEKPFVPVEPPPSVLPGWEGGRGPAGPPAGSDEWHAAQAAAQRGAKT